MEDKKKRRIGLITVICGVAVIAVIISAVLLFSGKVLKTQEYITTKTSGTDGAGKISVSVNYSMIEKELEDNSADFGNLMDFEDSVKVSAKPNEGLKNGDEVVIRFDYNKRAASKLGISFDESEFKITVSDLPEAEQIDPFENLKVSFSGISPYGKVMIDSTGCDPFSKNNVRFLCDSDNVKNGDIIKVAAQYNESAAENAMVYITKDEKEYTVSGLGEYISSIDNIDISDIENAISDKVLAEISKSRSDGAILGMGFIAGESYEVKSNYSFNNLKAVERYLYMKKPDSYASDTNILYTIYEVSIDEVNGNAQKMYINVAVEDIVKQDDGSLTYDELGARAYNSIESVRNKLNSIKDNYTSEQLGIESVIVPTI